MVAVLSCPGPPLRTEGFIPPAAWIIVDRHFSAANPFQELPMARKNHPAPASAPFPGAAASNGWPAWGSKTLASLPNSEQVERAFPASKLRAGWPKR